MHAPIDDLLIDQNARILDALKLIDHNAKGICFVTNQKKQLVGTLTDGDIRRYIIEGNDLSNQIQSIVNKHCISLPINSNINTIFENLSQQIKFIPLVDENNVVVDYASVKRAHNIPVLEPSINGNELEYVTECVETGWISSKGRFVSNFENMFSQYHDNRFCLAVSSGTTALELALLSLKIGPGDEVILPDFTFAACANAIINVGATPVLVDIKQDDWTIDPVKVERVITPKTRAIMAVHIYGYPCDMDSLIEIASQHKLKVIEDCAESLGSQYEQQKTGTIADVATFSFFGNKIITTGEGGMVVFGDKRDYEYGKIIRDHGMSPVKRYWHDMVGRNYRMTNLQAAIGVAQMERIQDILKARSIIKLLYDNLIQNNPIFTTQNSVSTIQNCNWLYTIRLSEGAEVFRDELIDKLLKNGIECRPAFYPLHEMPPYQAYGNGEDFPVTEQVSYSTISLPTSSSLTEKEISRIVKTLEDLLNIKKLYRA